MATTYQTLTINGRDYSVEYETRPDKELDTYWITSARGFKYYTIRNKKRPHLMFIVSDGNFGTKHALSRVWLSDEGGTLREVKVA